MNANWSRHIKRTAKQLLGRLGYELRRLPESERIKASGDLKKIFTYIYRENVWGGERGQLYSGPGSHESVSKQYIEIVNDFIKQRDVKTVIDVGCGDFRVWRLLDTSSIHYIGIDIVPDLIDRNTSLYGSPRITFACLNAVRDELPDGDLCLVRQVLQHLSNDHISKILKKLKKYRYVIVSEHLPIGENIIPNLDMQAHWHIRALQNSGVFIDQAPFNCKSDILLELNPDHPGYENSIIRTSLIQNHP
jgi:SAM-dependent methyltransferase